jgi:hypothetical protein
MLLAARHKVRSTLEKLDGIDTLSVFSFGEGGGWLIAPIPNYRLLVVSETAGDQESVVGGPRKARDAMLVSAQFSLD